MEEERLLTTEAFAKRLGIHPDTVRRWLRAGKVHGVRLGGTRLGWRIPESEIKKLMLRAN